MNYCSRVDVVFDRYYEQSIKGGTRQTRSGKSRPIRRIIDNKSIKLPENWHNCITLDDNKVNLAEFLCQELVKNPPDGGKEVFVGGGCVEIDKTMSSVGRDVSQLCATHEEAGTRILLHAKDAHEAGFERTIIACQDSDVIVMLVTFC